MSLYSLFEALCNILGPRIVFQSLGIVFFGLCLSNISGLCIVFWGLCIVCRLAKGNQQTTNLTYIRVAWVPICCQTYWAWLTAYNFILVCTGNKNFEAEVNFVRTFLSATLRGDRLSQHLLSLDIWICMSYHILPTMYTNRDTAI